MTYKLNLAIATLLLSSSCIAQEGLTIQPRNKQTIPVAGAQQIYLSACTVVQKEFRANRVPRPHVTLIVGADMNEVKWDSREIRLIKWDPYLFAQGVEVFAFDDLMPNEERMKLARRAVTWANSTIEVNHLKK